MNGASRPGVASEAGVVPRSILDEAGRVAVDDHDLFTGFSVQTPAGMSAADIASTLGEGTRSDGDDHLWIAETAIRHWVSDRATENWDQGSWGMVDYARSKGWTDEVGTHLRAHIDRVD